MSWYVSDELYDVCQVVLVPGVVFSRVRLKQVIAGRHLEGHARRGPDVCGGPVPSAQQNLQRPILTGLNVLCEVVILQETRKKEEDLW